MSYTAYVTYLGLNLPSEEIVRATQFIGANVLMLRITFSSNVQLIEVNLRSLRQFLPPHVAIFIGRNVVRIHTKSMPLLLVEVNLFPHLPLALFRKTGER